LIIFLAKIGKKILGKILTKVIDLFIVITFLKKFIGVFGCI